MSQNIKCPSCGAEIIGAAKFCGSCGSSLQRTAAIGVSQNPTAIPCYFEGNASPAVPSPAENGLSGKLRTTGRISEFKAKFDSFMGASIDISAIGKGFDASKILMGGFDEEQLRGAFSYFGKSLEESTEHSFISDQGKVTRRKDLEILDEEAQEMEDRDFAIQETSIVCGEMAERLDSAIAPQAEDIAGEYAQALKNQTKSRTKTRVALGEMTRDEAIEKLERA